MGSVKEWRSRHTNLRPAFWSYGSGVRLSTETNGVVFSGKQNLQCFGALAAPDAAYTVFVVVRWNQGAGRQGLLRFVNTVEEVEAGGLEVEGGRVRFSHRAKKGGPMDEVELDAWGASGPAQLVEAKRAPFLSGTVHSLGNGTTSKVVPAAAGPFTGNQMVMMGLTVPNPPQLNYLFGAVHEVVWLGGSVTPAEEKAVVEYLRVKWGL
jgi:hypothetical protein